MKTFIILVLLALVVFIIFLSLKRTDKNNQGKKWKCL